MLAQTGLAKSSLRIPEIGPMYTCIKMSQAYIVVIWPSRRPGPQVRRGHARRHRRQGGEVRPRGVEGGGDAHGEALVRWATSCGFGFQFVNIHLQYVASYLLVSTLT